MSFIDGASPEKMKLIRSLIWAGTFAFTVIMASMTMLAWYDKDFSSVMVAVGAFVMNALGFLIYGKVNQVKDQVNGNTTRQLDIIDRKTVPHNQISTSMVAPVTPAPDQAAQVNLAGDPTGPYTLEDLARRQ